jgi:hypothetical protein
MIEITTFRLLPGADEAGFLAADRDVQTGFAYQQPGLIRRTTARGAEGEWVVIELWRSDADADAAAIRRADDPRSAAVSSVIEPSSVRLARFTELS